MGENSSSSSNIFFFRMGLYIQVYFRQSSNLFNIPEATEDELFWIAFGEFFIIAILLYFILNCLYWFVTIISFDFDD